MQQSQEGPHAEISYWTKDMGASQLEWNPEKKQKSHTESHKYSNSCKSKYCPGAISNIELVINISSPRSDNRSRVGVAALNKANK